MDLTDLRMFSAIAEHGGVTRAAAALNTVQSNVTTRLKALEENLGTTLFDRHSRGVALTASGRRLLPFAHRIEALVEEARLAVRDDGVPGGTLSIGAMETTAALRLPPILATYSRLHPDVELTVGTGHTTALVRDVLERRCEMALVAGPVNHPELEEMPAFAEELVIATAPGTGGPESLARNPRVRIVVFRSGCCYRQRLENLLLSRGIVGVRVLEFGTLEGIIGCVTAGIGLTLLPRRVLEAAEKAGALAIHPLPRDEGAIETMMIRRRDSYVSSAAEAFLAVVAASAAESGVSAADRGRGHRRAAS